MPSHRRHGSRAARLLMRLGLWPRSSEGGLRLGTGPHDEDSPVAVAPASPSHAFPRESAAGTAAMQAAAVAEAGGQQQRSMLRSKSDPASAPPESKAAVPGSAAASIWLFCAQQWSDCACEGDVRWGNKEKWKMVRLTGGAARQVVKCDINTLGDHLPGDDGKHCECEVVPGTDYFNSINPGLLPSEALAKLPVRLVASCDLFEEGAQQGDWGAQQWEASKQLCNSDDAHESGAASRGPRALDNVAIHHLMKAWVVPRFVRNYARLYRDGWVERAFVNYYAGAPYGKHANMTEELINSVHRFSSEPIVVMHFGFNTVPSWTEERFPRLVVMNVAPMPSSAGRSFNFNKLRAMLLSRARVGVELDSDQFVAPGVDKMFEFTKREITKDYPMPILPPHFLDWSPTDQGPGGQGHKLWDRYCPGGKRDQGGCKWQTLRWGHAHPTWTFWATPFLGRWLRRNFLDETLPERDRGSGVMPALRVLDVKEDEDLLNVATWEEGGTKQWCKYDLPDPVEFQVLLATKGDFKSCNVPFCGDIPGDPLSHPHDIAKLFLTAHHAVVPKESQKYIEELDTRHRARTLPPPYLYHRHFYASAAELKEANPSLTCLA